MSDDVDRKGQLTAEKMPPRGTLDDLAPFETAQLEAWKQQVSDESRGLPVPPEFRVFLVEVRPDTWRGFLIEDVDKELERRKAAN